MNKWIVRLLWVTLALGAGAVQENWKIDINYILDLHVHVPNYESLPVAERAATLKSKHPYMPYDYYFNHTNNNWILALSIKQLKVLKWLLTIGFVGLFFFFNLRIIKTFPEAQAIVGTYMYGYILAFVVSFAIYLAGKWVGLGDTTYAVAREVVGGLQSLIPSMILVPLLMFQRQLDNKKEI
jgi:hypothetical protein